MKSVIKNKIMMISMFFISLIHASYAGSSSQYFEKPEDYSIVEDIKRKSNITQSDVTKYKLVALGMLQKPFAYALTAGTAAAGGFGAYKAQEMATEKMVEFPAVAEMLGKMAPTQENKWLWAVAGAIGLGYGAYRVLYPRLRTAILAKVNKFVELCEGLQIAKNDYNKIDVSTLGNAEGNAAWKSSNIAISKGIKNLLEQQKNALNLLDYLDSFGGPTPETQALRRRITDIAYFLHHNDTYFSTLANQERATDIAGAHQEAQLEAEKQKAGLMKATKVAVWWDTLTKIVTGTKNAISFLYENQGKIGAAIGGIAIYATIDKLRNK